VVIKKIKVKVLVLGIALLAAIILVYLVMVGLYDSFIPVCVLFAIPLSFIGAMLALALTNNSLNIFTILGIYAYWTGV
jgi:HAE1 family hydrophobic/amphiphilic exporter-1